MSNQEDLGDYVAFTDIRRQIGRGTFGTVMRGEHKESEELVAVKMIDEKKIKEKIKKTARQAEGKVLPQEVNVLQRIQELSGHPNVVEFLHHESKGGFLWVVLEYCEYGDLNAYVTKNLLDKGEEQWIILDSVKAVNYLHGIKPEVIVHRDLKPENLLVTYLDDHISVKLCGFGEAAIIPDDEFFRLRSVHGTPAFMAPEVLRGLEDSRQRIHYDQSVDTYAMGVIIWAIIHRVPKSSLYASIPSRSSNQPLSLDTSKDMIIQSLAVEMMRDRDTDRPSMSRVYRLLASYLHSENYGANLKSKEEPKISIQDIEIQRLKVIAQLTNRLDEMTETVEIVQTQLDSAMSALKDNQAEQNKLQSELDSATSKLRVTQAKLVKLQMTSFPLPPHCYCDMSHSGKLYLLHNDRKTVSLYRPAAAGFTLQWTRTAPAPTGGWLWNWIHATGDWWDWIRAGGGGVMLYHWNRWGKVTVLMDAAGKEAGRWQVGGALRGASSTHTVYAVGSHGDRHLHVYTATDHRRRLFSLKSAGDGGTWRWPWVSIGPDGRYFVVDDDRRQLAAFSPTGERLYQQQTSYKSDRLSPAASPDHVYVGDNNKREIHVHRAGSGAAVTTLTAETLQLQEEDRIYGVWAGQEDTLCVRVQDKKGNNKIVTYTGLLL